SAPVQERRNYGGVPGLTARYREDGVLLVLNRGANRNGFAICLRCGYADSERQSRRRAGGRIDLPDGFAEHAPLHQAEHRPRCWRNDREHSPVNRYQLLAARETTDVLMLDFSACSLIDARDRCLIATLAYGLQRAAARRLELDTREIGVLLVPTADGG